MTPPCGNELCDKGWICRDVDGTPRCILPWQANWCAQHGLADGERCARGATIAFHCVTGICVEVPCGDGVVDHTLGELCDDGPQNSDTLPGACRTDCTSARCGDGVVDPDLGEWCDDGPQNSDTPPGACRTDCIPATCGDAVADPTLGEACDDGNRDPWDGCTRCLVSEVTLNATPNGEVHRFAALSGGGFVASWAHDPRGNVWGTTRVYDEDGGPIHSLETWSYPVEGTYLDLSGGVRSNRSGGFLWVSVFRDWTFGAIYRIDGQVLDSSGLLTSRFRYRPGYDPYAESSYPVSWATLGVAPDGRFVLLWREHRFDTSPVLMLQRYTAAASTVGDPIQVTGYPWADPVRLHAGMAADGRCLVTWEDGNTPGNLILARFHADGTRAATDILLPHSTPLTDLVVHDDLSLTALWREPDADGLGVYLQRYDAQVAPQPVGLPQLVNVTTVGDQRAAGVARAGADLVVVWGSDAGIFVRRLDGQGQPLSDEIRVDTDPPGNSRSGDVCDGHIDGFPDGGFIVGFRRRVTATLDRLQLTRFDAQDQRVLVPSPITP